MLSDRVLQIVGVIWLVTFALGVRGSTRPCRAANAELLTGWSRTAPTAATVVEVHDAGRTSTAGWRVPGGAA